MSGVIRECNWVRIEPNRPFAAEQRAQQNWIVWKAATTTKISNRNQFLNESTKQNNEQNWLVLLENNDGKKHTHTCARRGEDEAAEEEKPLT